MKKRKGLRRVAGGLMIVLSLATAGVADKPDWPDWPDWPDSAEIKKTRSGRHTSGDKQPSLNPLVQGIHFFQRYISVVDSPRCPMYPTCSAYALQALEKHGPALGTFITVDRLLHETSPQEQTVPLSGFDRPRFYDPLCRNDFWLSGPR